MQSAPSKPPAELGERQPRAVRVLGAAGRVGVRLWAPRRGDQHLSQLFPCESELLHLSLAAGTFPPQNVLTLVGTTQTWVSGPTWQGKDQAPFPHPPPSGAGYGQDPSAHSREGCTAVAARSELQSIEGGD